MELAGPGDRGDGPQISPGSCSPRRKQWPHKMTPKVSSSSLNCLGIQAKVCLFLYYFLKPWLMDRFDKPQTHLCPRRPRSNCWPVSASAPR